MRFLKSGAVGAILSLCLGAITFFFPFFDAFRLYAAPAQLLMPLVGTIIPDRLLHRIFPNAGPPAGVFLITVCAVLFWTVALGSLHVLWQTKHRKTVDSLS